MDEKLDEKKCGWDSYYMRLNSREKILVNHNYVTKNLGELAKDTDLSKFIL